MNRVRSIRLKEFRSLMHELRKLYCEINCELTIHYRNISWSAVRSGMHPRYGYAYGYYLPTQNKAVVTFRGKVPRWKKLMVIAHELRHAQHQHRNLYSKYWSNIDTAWKAEVNCDTWAIKWLISNDIKVDEVKARNYIDYESFKRSRLLIKNKQS